MKKKYNETKEAVKDEAVDQAKEFADDHPKAKSAAAATGIGKKFYDTFEQAREAKDDIKESFEEVGDKLGETKEKFKDRAEDAKDELENQMDNAKEEIKDNAFTRDKDDDDGIKSAADIKGYSGVKGASSIKGASYIKKP
nr:YtxH domain-containing protein [Alkalicoccus halolimnae]TXF85128.1 hypothetical protein FTX54_09925 [Alkalicoccus halolimnae]